MKARRGLSLIEVLISLAIMATLLTAVAAALTATARVVNVNDEFFRSAQASRVTMNLILAEVRRCTNVLGVNSTALQVITDDGRDITWTYVPAAGGVSGRITLTDAATGVVHTLARNISSARFAAVMGTNANNTPCIVQVTAEITAAIDDAQLTLSGSSVPRANLRY